MKDFLELARERYSVRKFEDRKIEPEKLAKIIAAGNVAPTAKNYQPQKIYVVQSEEGLAKLSRLSPCLYGAKTVLMIGYDTEKEWISPVEPGYRSGVEDASIVATHMMLEAWDLGIGSCWVNYFPVTETEKEFSLPANEKLVLLLPIGYAAPDSEPSESHSEYPEQETCVKII